MSALVSFPGSAQSVADIELDAAGTCPRREDLVRLNPALEEGSVGGLINRIATPARSGVRAHPTSTLRGAPIEGFSLTFDDEVEVLAGTPLGRVEGGPALIQRLREPRCGWINVADLERFAIPMRLLQIPPFARETDRFGQANRLEARVVIKNRFDRETGYAQRAPLFNAPFVGDVEPPEDQRRGSLGYLEVLSVFEVRQANGQECRTFRDADCFLRVGSSTTLAGRYAGLVRTRGWVRGVDVEIWPWSLALYFAPGKQGLKIHATQESALMGTPFETPGARESILAYQPQGRFEEPRVRNILRFPIIRGIRLTKPNESTSGATASAAPASYVYEILFNAQACIEGTSGGQQGDCLPEPRIRDEVAHLGQTVRATSNIDVLFVVDATESMGPYLQAVVRGIKKQLEKAIANRQWSFRYSVVLYGDYNRKRDAGLDYYALPFSSDMSGLDPLQKAGVYEDENKDIPEAPFAALERAASTVQWRPEAANRLIIWIADHGNRPPGKHTTAAGELIETKTAQSVVDAIKGTDARLRAKASATGGGTKTRFLAIQVKGGATGAGESEQYFQKFRQDAEAIRRGLGETTFTTIPAAIDRGSNEDQSALVDAITGALDKSVQAVAEARRMVLGALGGDTTGIQANLPPSALLARDFLADLGFPAARLRETGRRIQIVRTGFVFQSGQNPDYRYWLGLREPEFGDISQKARALCENLRYADRVNAVEESILAFVRALTATEMRPNESVREFYSRVFSLTIDLTSPILGAASPAKFIGALRKSSPAQQERVIAAVCKKARMLQYIANGQIVDERDLVSERNRVNLRSGAAPKDFDWRWITSDAQVVWYFIPFDVVP